MEQADETLGTGEYKYPTFCFMLILCFFTLQYVEQVGHGHPQDHKYSRDVPQHPAAEVRLKPRDVRRRKKVSAEMERFRLRLLEEEAPTTREVKHYCRKMARNLLNEDSIPDRIEDSIRSTFDITTFTLIAFDECHNTVKNAPCSVSCPESSQTGVNVESSSADVPNSCETGPGPAKLQTGVASNVQHDESVFRSDGAADMRRVMHTEDFH
ncbi:unnamed protein product [Heligmosomoides polygyrus]|uniref:Uncharacterized protein n=1 Tax=Heligmosomoides polygyrus TaxID=6339 RepID=A0A3P8EPR7_HELPZ|nr:unnamed protein product [Heligmosomoides polygyrus]